MFDLDQTSLPSELVTFKSSGKDGMYGPVSKAVGPGRVEAETRNEKKEKQP